MRVDAIENVAVEGDANDAVLLGALDRLTDRQRAAVLLRFYLQCSEAEIADALKCRRGTVKSLLARGLTVLRAELSDAKQLNEPNQSNEPSEDPT